jgi:nucleotide-binding universal stress UspA family protein
VEAEPHVARLPEVTFKRILISTDFSPSSEAALRYAAGMARRFGSRVYLFTVVEPTLFNVAGPGALSLAIDATWRDMRRLERELVVEGCFAGLQIELLVRSGDVCEEMSETVSNQHIDLIAMGTRGRTGASRLLLGSVAQHVFQQSRVPVLLVGPNVDANLWAEGVKRVLFPTDFTAASRYAFPAAVSLARRSRAQLTAMHVLAPLTGEALADPDRVRASIQQSMRETFSGAEDVLNCHRSSENVVF